MIVLYAGAATAVGLLVAGVVTRIVAGRDNAVGVAVFVTVFAAVVAAAVRAGEYVVRRMPR